MKKILLIFTLILLFINSSDAKDVKVKVESLSSMSIYEDNQSLRARVIDDTKLKNDIVLQKDSILDSKMIEIIPPKRAKRNGYLIIEPVVYIYDNLVIPIKSEELRAKVTYYTKPDYKKKVKDAAIGAGASFIKGGQYVARFSEGVIKADEGESKVKSGFENLYQNSVISYIGKGKEINIKKGDLLVYKFFFEDTPKWQFWKR